jgi:N-acetylmuramoyl-L-alanine amidase
LFLSLFAFWVIQFWYNKFIKDNIEEEDHENPYNKTFFSGVNFISGLLLAIGIIAAVIVYFSSGNNIFKSLGLIISIIWAVAFLKYFVWSVYFYNINYGLTDNDWKRIDKAKARKRNNEEVDPKELKEPERNPYDKETFGLPQGTVRGMIAFTLLFGAISMLIVSMGNESRIDENSATWDQLEFFKTAFLMMIAFYFGDKSLQYLKGKGTDTDNAKTNPNNPNGSGNSNGNQSKEPANSGVSNPSEKPQPSAPAATGFSEVKKQLANSESDKIKGGYIPIIDAGHGGIDENGNYKTAGKRYKFLNYLVNGEPFTVYEGDVNRKIANKLIGLLKVNGINYYYINQNNEIPDISLPDRVKMANDFYTTNKNSYILSIHCNTAGDENEGNGSIAKGFEIFTSRGQNQSDELATIAAKWYKKDFPDSKFRQEMEDGDPDKEANFFVLRNTNCPAFLIENLFYDNLEEAKFLASDEGQTRIAQCLFKIAREINQLS